MKITKIHINDYQQFKNFELDIIEKYCKL